MNIKPIRYLISGGSAALIEYVTFLLLHALLGISGLILAQTLSFLTGLGVSFTINKIWVFKSTQDIKKELFPYLSLALFNVVAGNAVMYWLVELLNAKFWSAKILVMALVALWNYAIFSKLIFSNRDDV